MFKTEQLENRRLLAAVLVGNQLQITGGAGVDNVQVSQQDAATIRVSFNGAVSLFNDANVASILINGVGGNDTLNIVPGAGATLLAEPATVNGGEGNDLIRGGAGNDALNGNNGNDNIGGNAGNDNIDGGAGNNNLQGGDGNDVMTAGTGSDIFNGGTGNDTGNYSTRAAAVSISEDGAANDGQFLEGDNVQENVETVNGGAGNDIITAGPGVVNNVFNGNGGNDRLNARSGNDSVNGGSGDDTGIGGAGNDKLAGGAGNDVLVGGGGNDVLTGGDGNDVLNGGLGIDQLFGENGNDVLLAADGGFDSILNGGTGTDIGDRDAGDAGFISVEIVV